MIENNNRHKCEHTNIPVWEPPLKSAKYEIGLDNVKDLCCIGSKTYYYVKQANETYIHVSSIKMDPTIRYHYCAKLKEANVTSKQAKTKASNAEKVKHETGIKI